MSFGNVTDKIDYCITVPLLLIKICDKKINLRPLSVLRDCCMYDGSENSRLKTYTQQLKIGYDLAEREINVFLISFYSLCFFLILEVL
jgi:hypothetical protein